MPDNPSDVELPRAEPGKSIVPESADEQNQEVPSGHRGKTFQELARDVMSRHAELFPLLAESERRCREPRTQGRQEDLSGPLDKGDQLCRPSYPDP